MPDSPNPIAAPHPAHRPTLAIGLRLLAMLCLGVMLAAIKLADQRGVHVVESLFFRQALSLPIVLIWIWAGPGIGILRTSRIGAHASRTVAGMIGMIFNFVTVTMLPLAEATTIGFTAPLFATILSFLILRERTGIHRWAAVLLGFMGVLFMVRPDADHFPMAGVLVALSGSVMVAVTVILLRQIGRTEAAPTTVFWFTVLSLPPLLVGEIIFGQAHDAATWGLLLLIGVSGGAGQLCLTGSLRWAPVSVVVPMDYTGLIWATLFGWLIWDQWPQAGTWIGAAIIVGSGLYIVWRERVNARPASPTASTEID